MACYVEERMVLQDGKAHEEGVTWFLCRLGAAYFGRARFHRQLYYVPKDVELRRCKVGHDFSMPVASSVLSMIGCVVSGSWTRSSTASPWRWWQSSRKTWSRTVSSWRLANIAAGFTCVLQPLNVAIHKSFKDLIQNTYMLIFNMLYKHCVDNTMTSILAITLRHA
ncbi:hypothetical protein, variant 2 [Aphanomyces astaci]|uniref:Uncharacterized protein n=1 Tax=Aphanomyces astaci TaxID=112090 RepID=W4H9X3_APHAT|nr:hypothetical protein, variant 2 [Aphanomyces astaci]ETV88722.1 hypothetical protein, variant 2 [Aphanomyces astaci]|eukprot:XP_009821122.1 hypothetical protein, variant 2 [Aphanomyces astaci]